MQFNDVVVEKAEAGCLYAYLSFENSMAKIGVYLANRNIRMPEPTRSQIRQFPFLAEVNPVIISNNILLPYLVAAIEDYFKNTFIALLRYSPKKLSILKNAKILPEDLDSIASNELTVFDAIVRTMSFQNVNKLCASFKQLDDRLDIYGILQKPYRRRKETFFKSLERIFSSRHSLIHQNQMVIDYLTADVERDVRYVREAIRRIYDGIQRHHRWRKIY